MRNIEIRRSNLTIAREIASGYALAMTDYKER